jgi:hypothetical protein
MLALRDYVVKRIYRRSVTFLRGKVTHRCKHEIETKPRANSTFWKENTMSRKLNTLSVLFAFTVLLIVASSAMAQTSRNAMEGRRLTTKAAVVAIKRGDKLQLAGEKDRLIGAVQKALDSVKEGGAVRDISIRSFEKVNYLAVLIEKQGTLFLQLEPSGGGIQGLYLLEEKYLYCASGGCTACDLFMTGPVTANGPGGPHCECDKTINHGPNSVCQLKPRLYVNKLVQQINVELLAIGFEETEEATSSSETPKLSTGTPRKLEISPARTNPIKRPNN